MSTTLDLFGCLLAYARKMLRLGRTRDARDALLRLVAFTCLPDTVAAEAHRRLGELYFHADCHRKARRHLRRALALEPAHAGARFLYASCIARDPAGDLRRAWRHGARALRAEPENPEYLVGMGRLAFRRERDGLALRLLRKAHRLAPDDPRVLEAFADVLGQLGRLTEARGALIAARFRNPSDPAVAKVWNDFRFAELRRRQQQHSAAGNAGNVVLRFPAEAVAGEAPVRGKLVRRDAGAATPAPHLHRLGVLRLRPRKAR